jgi:hypothetical protein
MTVEEAIRDRTRIISSLRETAAAEASRVLQA